MKVLIISHNPITTYQSMGKTFLSLFSSFEKEELCQLYIYPTIPDIDVCNSYYRVTDREVLKSFAQFGKIDSRVFSSCDIDTEQHSLFESEDDAAFYKKNKKGSFSLIGRDLMWSLAGWYNSSLKKWLFEEKPTCIFLAPGESKFIYNIALRIANRFGIDIYTYVCDEFYFVQKPVKFFDRLHFGLLRKKMKEVMRKSKGIITICDELANAYHDEFGTETHTIFTGTNYSIVQKPFIRQEVCGITFMGNMSCNRFNSIADIGKALDNLNEIYGTDYRLFLYTSPIKETTQRIFSKIKSIHYAGYVTGDEFEKVLHNTDILLHVEAFDEKSIERVKHSISTKIADSLGSGALLFAYGPEKIASMQHLIRNKCAVVVTKQEELQRTLYRVLYEINREEIINRELSIAKIYHTSDKNSKTLYNILNDQDS